MRNRKLGNNKDRKYKKEGKKVKIQWNMLFGIIFALIVAVFAVINVDSVSVNYLFGVGQWPLILVIIISVLLAV